MSQVERFSHAEITSVYEQAWQLELGGRHAEARSEWKRLFERETIPENKALLLCDIGLTQRMDNDYQAAEESFQEAHRLGITANNPSVQVEALAGLMDTYRTFDRDKSDSKPKRLAEAKECKRAALVLFSAISESANLAKINFELNSALLWWETDDNDKALGDLNIAEAMCNLLLYYQPENRLIKSRQARVLTVKGVTLGKLGRLNEALTTQEMAYHVYVDLNDVRGMGNAAISAGDVFQKQGKNEDARKWFEKARETSQKQGEVVDKTIYDMANKRLANLPEATSTK